MQPLRAWRFLRDECGQDLIEYTLMVAFVALSSAALYVGAGAENSWSHPSGRTMR
jgi:Flp pilus assembly pilin Flp